MPRKFAKVRLTRAPHDFDVSVPKISTPRFSTMLIPVKYLHKVKTHRPGHHPLNAAFPNGPSPKPITTSVISNAPNLVVSKFRQNQVFD